MKKADEHGAGCDACGAKEAERERKAFQEKLMRAAVTKTELDSMVSKVKGRQDAVQRDQLIGMMMAGF